MVAAREYLGVLAGVHDGEVQCITSEVTCNVTSEKPLQVPLVTLHVYYMYHHLILPEIGGVWWGWVVFNTVRSAGRSQLHVPGSVRQNFFLNDECILPPGLVPFKIGVQLRGKFEAPRLRR